MKLTLVAIMILGAIMALIILLSGCGESRIKPLYLPIGERERADIRIMINNGEAKIRDIELRRNFMLACQNNMVKLRRLRD